MTHDTLKPLFSWRGAICESDRSPTSKLVALALSLYMNEKGGSAFPGADRLRRDTSLHVSTVRAELKALVTDGWLVVIEQGGRRGERRRANAYEVRVPIGNPSPETTRRLGRAVGVTTQTPRSDQTDPSPEPIPSLQELSNELAAVAADESAPVVLSASDAVGPARAALATARASRRSGAMPTASEVDDATRLA